MNRIGDLLRAIGYLLFSAFMVAILFLNGLIIDCLGGAAMIFLGLGIPLSINRRRKEYQKRKNEALGITSST